MLDLVIGDKRNPVAVDQLIRALGQGNFTGSLYIGYPILASVDEPIQIDALLTTRETGIVIFDFAAPHEAAAWAIGDRQDDLAAALQQKLMGYKELRDGRSLRVEPQVITLVPQELLQAVGPGVIIATPDTVLEGLAKFGGISHDDLRRVNAAIQRLTTIKPTNKRTGVQRANSRGAKMKVIDKEIANLDQWQKRAAIEAPEGVQRIRGLAGSGKTIVLALKAAYLHVRHPEWKIALTFQTRSLYQQFRDLVRRFTFEHLNDEPHWDNLRVVHAWGGSRQPGVYSDIASTIGVPVRDFTYGKNTFGYGAAFDGVCRELLQHINGQPMQPIYDAILIDEAQDLPRSFFELAYRATGDPHRVIFAYDELQNLGEYSMAPPSELFGKRDDGRPRVPELTNEFGLPARDIVLPVCYRNTPWALTVAHALGFGIYREEGLVQFFEEVSLFQDVGYQVIDGRMELGASVSIRRAPTSAPDYFERLLTPADAVQTYTFDDKATQAEAVANMILCNIREDELELRDILVILSDPVSAATEAAPIIRALNARDIPAHLAGVTSSRDMLFEESSVAVSGIYRAKGNEAPMVYVLNADYTVSGPGLSKRRNIVFTAMTRSRAWVRLCGVGERMDKLRSEVDQVFKNKFELRFDVPTTEELARMRKIHRDLSPEEKQRAKAAADNLRRLIEQLERGDLSADNLPQEQLGRLRELLERDGAE